MTRHRPPADLGDDILTDPSRHRRTARSVPLRRGLVIEVLGDGFVGRVAGLTSAGVVLEDRRGRRRTFGLHPGVFLLDDEPVTLVPPDRPPPAPPTAPQVTASGSIAVSDAPARVARASRIWVEGVHDAELLEKVWGDDLRIEGIVVEPLGGIDDLVDDVRGFAPGPRRRLGVLVDHLVPGSKEARITAKVRHAGVLITGHPFVDVWAAVKPEVVGIDAWPQVPMGTPWKEGICAALGRSDPRAFWRELLGSVSRYTDLDRSLVGSVERLIDFVTVTDE